MSNERKDILRRPIAVYRPPGRPGIEPSLVHRAADQLLEAGQRPTIERVRRVVGGSPNTLGPLLDEWWKGLAGRLRSRAPGAFDRLPGELGLIAEAFFQEAVSQARQRVQSELHREREELDRAERDVEIKAHVLSHREQELSELVKIYQARNEELEARLKALEVSERKARAAEALLQARVLELLEEIAKSARKGSSKKKASKKKVAKKKTAKKKTTKKVAKKKTKKTTKKKVQRVVKKTAKKPTNKKAKKVARKKTKKAGVKAAPTATSATGRSKAATKKKPPTSKKTSTTKPAPKSQAKKNSAKKTSAKKSASKRAAKKSPTKKSGSKTRSVSETSQRNSRKRK